MFGIKNNLASSPKVLGAVVEKNRGNDNVNDTPTYIFKTQEEFIKSGVRLKPGDTIGIKGDGVYDVVARRAVDYTIIDSCSSGVSLKLAR